MSLANLTTGGWLVFVWWVALFLGFIMRLAFRHKHAMAFHIILLSCVSGWLAYLVSP